MTAQAKYISEGHRLRVEEAHNPNAWIESNLTCGDLMYLNRIDTT